AAIEGITFLSPTIPLASALDDASPDTPDFWARHIRSPVDFSRAIQKHPHIDTWIEIGPHTTLAALIKTQREGNVLVSMRRERGEALWSAVSKLWALGGAVDLVSLLPTGPVGLLPAYAFQRRRYWLEAAQPGASMSAADDLAGHALILPSADFHHVLSLSASRQPWLAEHVVLDTVIVPGAFYLSAFLAVAAQRFPGQGLTLRDVQFLRPLQLVGTAQMSIVLSQVSESRWRLEASSQDASESWVRHATGSVQLSAAHPSVFHRLDALQEQCAQVVPIDDFYAALERVRLQWGEGWCWTEETRIGDGQTLARITPKNTDADAPLHPTLLDNGFASAMIRWGLAGGADFDPTPRVPLHLDALRFYQRPVGPVWCHGLEIDASEDGDRARVDLTFIDSTGQLVASLDGLTIKRADPAIFLSSPAASKTAPRLLRLDWQEATLPPEPEVEGSWIVLGEGADADAFSASLTGVPVARHGALTGHSDVVVFWSASQPAEVLLQSAIQLIKPVLEAPEPPRVTWVTRGAHTQSPDQHALWGLGRTLALEHPRLRLSLLDLDGDIPAPIRALRMLPEVRWSGVAETPTLRKTEPAEQPAAITGSWLVTGGSGALGGHIGAWLQGAGASQVLLASRSGTLPEGSTCEATLLDVSDAAAVRAFFADHPDITGIVHAAGVLDDAPIASLESEQLQRVLAPKVAGTRNLDDHAPSTVAHFVLFSSMVSLLGAPGQPGYAAANSFMDGIVALRHARKRPATSLCWGPWSGGGMFTRTGAAAQSVPFPPMTPEQGVALLAESLAMPQGVYAALILDRERLRRVAEPPAMLRAFVPEAASKRLDSGLRAHLSPLAPAERTEALQGIVRTEIARVAELPSPDAVPLTQPLQELGIGSLVGMELRDALGALVGTELPATLVFDYPTVEAITEYLLEQLDLGEVVEETERTTRISWAEPIAVVGMACRFPGAADLDGFQALLSSGSNAITDVPPSRWDIDAWYDPDPEKLGKMYARRGGFLDDIALFDPTFFGVSPREADEMDPQQRLLLEVSWKALENAGLATNPHARTTGVYMGICAAEYHTPTLADPTRISPHSLTGVSHSVAVGRLSYLLNFQGPNFPVDTACSSSLVSVHLGCQSLRSGECDVALA
ncbi:MAG: NAD(P)-dependent dehydrogenase (short-subunit alcohol dehydrogenase family), partial [Myxococcota bacterium]